MKKIFLLIILSGLSTDFVLAQEDTMLLRLPSERRQSRITLLKDQILGKNYWEEEFKGNWAGIFIGVNGLARTDYSDYPETEQDFFDPDLFRSYVINVNLLQFSQGLQRSRNTIGLVTGLGLELQSWHLGNRTTITEGPSRIEPLELMYDDPGKSKLVSSYLSVPLLIEFQVPMKEYGNRLYFSAGVILNRRLSSHTKVKYTHEGKHYKLKSPDDYYLRAYHYTGTFRIGYRWINLYASYDLQPLFNGKKGPEVFPYSVGFALISF
ncbi:MAG: outer membrane beta-barrel protein [Mangrovibacterium sp.]